MAQVRSKRLAGPVQTTVAVATIYTCPSGETAVVKSVWLTNGGANAGTIFLYVNGATAAALVWSQVLASGASVHINCFLCLGPGDTFRISGTSTGTLVVTISGAELEGVAD